MRNEFNAKRTMEKVKKAIEMAGSQQAMTLERYAKMNRPWTDRTSNARNSIKGTSGWQKDSYIIMVSGNVEYFKHLELARERRYSILPGTVRRHAPNMIKQLGRFG